MKTLKSCFVMAITTFSMLFSYSAFAEKRVGRSFGETTAFYTAKFINRHKTVEQFIKVFKPHMKGRDFRDFKRALQAKNISMKDKLPRVKAKGAKIYIAGSSAQIEIVDAKTILIGGHKFSQSKRGLTSQFEKMYSKISPKKKSKVSMANALVRQAHAFGDLWGIVSTFGVGLTGYFLAPTLGLSGVAGAAVGVGGLYLISELWQSLKSGEITCTDAGQYQVRSKARNSWLMAKEEQTVIYPSVNAMKNGGVSSKCSKSDIEKLEAFSEKDAYSTTQPAGSDVKSKAVYGG